MPRGRGQPPREISPGTRFGGLEIIEEIARVKTNRRFLCRCTDCGATGPKWLANLVQGKTTCLACTPWDKVNGAGRRAIIEARRERAQVSEEGRVCLTCGVWKPWAQFKATGRNRYMGRDSNCKECHREKRIARMYGLTRGELRWLYDQQEGACALCGEDGTLYRGESLSVDHDHGCCGPERACGKCIRGLLCSHCNRFLLAYVEPRPLLAARFADYLGRRPFASVSAGDAEAVLEHVRDVAEDAVA